MNIIFLIISAVSLILGTILETLHKRKYANLLFLIGIVYGILSMFLLLSK